MLGEGSQGASEQSKGESGLHVMEMSSSEGVVSSWLVVRSSLTRRVRR